MSILRIAIPLLTIAWLCAVLPLPSARAQDQTAFAGAALAADQLDELRGGFSEGLKIRLGIERSVFINDQLVSSMNLRIADLANISARGSAELLGSPVSLIQNGPGNVVSPAVLENFSSGMATIIQNSLDGQAIRGVTTIDATVSGVGNLGLSETLSSLNFQLRASH